MELLADLYVRHAVLSHDKEQALKAHDQFKECTRCPGMVVVPAGSFLMGSPSSADTEDADTDEFPQHPVTIGQRFAVSEFEVTFENWDTCYELGGCRLRPDDYGWGRGDRPVILVDWDDAQQYVSWLSQQTGKTYRLLSEAEWEYAARGGTTTSYSWGNDIKVGDKAMANCFACGSQWDDKETAPVGSFAPNAFGLHDTLGNVWEWVDDCYHTSYDGAPADGSAWQTNDCNQRVIRGGSWAIRRNSFVRHTGCGGPSARGTAAWAFAWRGSFLLKYFVRSLAHCRQISEHACAKRGYRGCPLPDCCQIGTHPEIMHGIAIFAVDTVYSPIKQRPIVGGVVAESLHLRRSERQSGKQMVSVSTKGREAARATATARRTL